MSGLCKNLIKAFCVSHFPKRARKSHFPPTALSHGDRSRWKTQTVRAKRVGPLRQNENAQSKKFLIHFKRIRSENFSDGDISKRKSVGFVTRCYALSFVFQCSSHKTRRTWSRIKNSKLSFPFVQVLYNKCNRISVRNCQQTGAMGVGLSRYLLVRAIFLLHQMCIQRIYMYKRVCVLDVAWQGCLAMLTFIVHEIQARHVFSTSLHFSLFSSKSLALWPQSYRVLGVGFTSVPFSPVLRKCRCVGAVLSTATTGFVPAGPQQRPRFGHLITRRSVAGASSPTTAVSSRPLWHRISSHFQTKVRSQWVVCLVGVSWSRPLWLAAATRDTTSWCSQFQRSLEALQRTDTPGVGHPLC